MLIFFPSVWFKYRVACEFNILCRAVLMILPTCCIERYLCNSLVDLWVKLIYNIVVLSECSTITGVLGYVCVCGGVFDMLPGQEFVDFITAESNDLYMYMWLVQIHFLHFHSCNNFEGLVFTKPSICTMLITVLVIFLTPWLCFIPENSQRKVSIQFKFTIFAWNSELIAWVDCSWNFPWCSETLLYNSW